MLTRPINHFLRTAAAAARIIRLQVDDENARIEVTFRLTESLGPDSLAADVALLSPDEQSRANRFFFADDRRDFVAAHALVRRALSRVRPLAPAAWRFVAGAHGKPMLAAADPSGSPLYFNLSHTRGLVACVVARDNNVGIDVERTGRGSDLDSLAARFFHASEVAHLRQLAEAARPTRFLELWTLKEAYLKGRGVGMTQPLRDCAFELAEPNRLTVGAEDEAVSAAWRFALYGVQGDRYRAAVAWTAHPPARIDIAWFGAAHPETARLLCISTARC